MPIPRHLPADARRSLRLYNLFFPLVFVFLLPGYLARMIRRGNYRAHFLQRLALYSKAERALLAVHRWTWIQSISVGETLVALKLAEELRRQEPQIQILLSVTTTTGFALAEQSTSAWLKPIYNPLDLHSIVRRALRTVKIVRFIVIEGGVWPNLASECYRLGAPLSIASARLSPRSERRFHRFHKLVGPIFRLFDLIAVPDPDDLGRWEKLGVPAGRIRVTGNIKFDQPAKSDSSRPAEFRALITALGVPPSAPIIVAGSTFPGEEVLLAQALLTLRPSFPDLFLILVPRHVERTPTILRELATLPLHAVLRSTLPSSSSSSSSSSSLPSSPPPPPPTPGLLLVDTTGELRDWYTLATIAFIGKSLTAIGGQNPAEPALLGKPIVFGPHMENFAALTQHLLTQGAAVQIPNAGVLTATLHTLLSDSRQRETMSAAARSALVAHRGATERTVGLLL